MNERFVCIKVDREERPDLDSIYMDAVVALTGHGGWPMTMFLTPGGEPFHGGTYFPPLAAARAAVVSRGAAGRLRCLAGATGRRHRGRPASWPSTCARARGCEPSAEPLSEALLAEAQRNCAGAFDATWGGWGGAPKFPPGPTLEFLLRRGETELTRRTLDGMAAGGMYDLVGGGFHRYSVDERWLVPHFEKMLYDNALLAPVYARAWRVLGDDRYRVVAEETVDYVLRELALEGGGFASAQDADTDGVEGLTFSWAPGEGAPDELLQPFEHGRFVLRGALAPGLQAELFAIREQRPKPLRDDKAIASWNGLMLAALAQCGLELDRPDWLDAGRRLAEFLLGPLSTADGPAAPHLALGRRRREPATSPTTPTSPTA